MRSSSIQEIKQELVTYKPAELTALCLRLARFKKENKELLTYLLFEAQDEHGYIKNVKQEVEELFATFTIWSSVKLQLKIVGLAVPAFCNELFLPKLKIPWPLFIKLQLEIVGLALPPSPKL